MIWDPIWLGDPSCWVGCLGGGGQQLGEVDLGGPQWRGWMVEASARHLQGEPQA